MTTHDTPEAPTPILGKRLDQFADELRDHVEGSHRLLSNGYCPDCNGSCLVGFGNPTHDTPEASCLHRDLAGNEAHVLGCAVLRASPPFLTLRPTHDTPEAARIVLHSVVCRVRPEGMTHSFVFDPQGILSDCRFLAALDGWTLVPVGHFDEDTDLLAECVRQQAEIARLRAALAYHHGGTHGLACTVCEPPPSRRAAPAPSEP